MCWINLLCGSQELNQSCRPWLSSHLCQPVYFIAGMCCVSLRWHFESINTKRTIFIKNLGGQHWRHGLYMFLEGHIKWIRDILNGFNYQHWNKISAKKSQIQLCRQWFWDLRGELVFDQWDKWAWGWCLLVVVSSFSSSKDRLIPGSQTNTGFSKLIVTV